MTRPVRIAPRLVVRTTPCPIVEARKALEVARFEHDQRGTIESAAAIVTAWAALDRARGVKA